MTRVESDQPTAAGPLSGWKILVVDDEPDARAFISAVLEDHGADTIQATSGAEALDCARREKPDLITLDLSMPGKSGIAVFRELRDDPDLMEIPVCIITGRPEMRSLIYQDRGPRPEGYIEKPLQAASLLRNVRKILEIRERRRDGK